ncbi:MAG: Rieske 2Fe-2S domain-containing protein [Chloroflexota bacterium]|mgnify:CR=1 FL=1
MNEKSQRTAETGVTLAYLAGFDDIIDARTPAEFAEARFWLVNLDQKAVNDPRHPAGVTTQPGIMAIYKVCVHLGCLYRWTPGNDRFECPCHASKYLKDGTRVRGPATRDLDKFVVRVLDADGNFLAATKVGDADSDPTVGQPIALPAGAATLLVDTGKRVRGRRRNGPGTVT